VILSASAVSALSLASAGIPWTLNPRCTITAPISECGPGVPYGYFWAGVWNGAGDFLLWFVIGTTIFGVLAVSLGKVIQKSGPKDSSLP
jgi:hypothetical protein